MTTTRKDAYGNTIETVDRSSGLTAPEAAKSIGVSTRKFGYVATRTQTAGSIVTGTEKNKYPVIVYSPEQVALIASESTRRDGNGHLLNS